MKPNRKRIMRRHIDNKLVFRLRMFFVIFLAITIFVIYDVIQMPLSILFVILSYALGTIIGFVASRMFNIVWHEKQEKVVSELDRVGVIILVLYFVVALSRNYIAGLFFSGQILIIISFSVIAGIMLGRLIGTGLKIRKVLLGKGKLF